MTTDHADIARSAFDASALPAPPRTPADALRYLTRLLQWLPASERAGYLLKPGGDNIAPLPDGTMVSCSRICYPDGQIYKTMSDAPNGNPQWVDNGVVDASLYRALTDGPAQPPVTLPPQPPGVNLEPRVVQLEALFNEIVKQIGLLNTQLKQMDDRLMRIEARPTSSTLPTHTHAIRVFGYTITTGPPQP